MDWCNSWIRNNRLLVLVYGPVHCAKGTFREGSDPSQERNHIRSIPQVIAGIYLLDSRNDRFCAE